MVHKRAGKHLIGAAATLAICLAGVSSVRADDCGYRGYRGYRSCGNYYYRPSYSYCYSDYCPSPVYYAPAPRVYYNSCDTGYAYRDCGYTYRNSDCGYRSCAPRYYSRPSFGVSFSWGSYGGRSCGYRGYRGYRGCR